MKKSGTKVCHISTVHPVKDIRIFQKECLSLVRAEYDVSLVAQHDKDEIVQGVHIKGIPRPTSRFDRVFNTLRKAYSVAIALDADIYHLHDPELMVLIPLLKLKGKSVIFDMHENFPKQILSKLWLPSFVRRPLSVVFRLIERLLLRLSFVIFAENSYKKDYRWLKTEETILNMPRLDLLQQSQGMKYDVPTLGYIGGVSNNRGFQLTYNAVLELRLKGLKVNWACIGRCDNETSQLIENEQINKVDGIDIYGYMNPVDGWKIIEKCHVGLSVLKPIPNYIESYPTKMFEYMAMGIPVIVSDFPIYKDIIEKYECGICVNPEKSEELYEAILFLITNREKADEMGANGRKMVLEKYNWKIEEKKLLHLYENIERGLKSHV